jgi:hypothetical protein
MNDHLMNVIQFLRRIDENLRPKRSPADNPPAYNMGFSALQTESSKRYFRALGRKTKHKLAPLVKPRWATSSCRPSLRRQCLAAWVPGRMPVTSGCPAFAERYELFDAVLELLWSGAARATRDLILVQTPMPG